MIFQKSQATLPVEALSVDGGKIRLRTELGKPCEWKDVHCG